MLLEDSDKLSLIFKKKVYSINIKEICTLWAGYGRILEARVLFSSASNKQHVNVINKVNNTTSM